MNEGKEAKHAQSKMDFVHKLSIAQKEASETNYWLRLLKESDYLSEKLAQSLMCDCEGIQRMLTASIKTGKTNVEKKVKQMGIDW